MKQTNFHSTPRTSYTYRFADGTTSTVHVGDIDENGVYVTEDMVALLYEMDEENTEEKCSSPAVQEKTPIRLIKGVYDTLNASFVKVPVTEDVYHEYMRGKEKIKEQDKKFFAHEIQMSQLIGGDKEGFDNFDEFISSEDELFDVVRHEALLSTLREEIDRLCAADQDLIDALFYKKISERAYSEISGLPQKTINNRKRVILSRLNKVLEKI